jgi:hypothetical protein
MHFQLPQGPLLSSQLLRASVPWAAIHVFLAIVAPGALRTLSFQALLVLCGVNGLLAAIDMRRRHQDVFFANLGIGKSTIVALWVAVAIALESVWSALAAVVAT